MFQEQDSGQSCQGFLHDEKLLASALCLSASSVVISPLCHLLCNVFLAATMCQPCQAVPVTLTELSEGIPYFLLRLFSPSSHPLSISGPVMGGFCCSAGSKGR